jgi:SAM-dependent methyltransferase
VQRHAEEIEANAVAWEERPLLRAVYAGLYDRIAAMIGEGPGKIIELGSGIGNLRTSTAGAILTDVIVHQWLDVACSAYRLPFRSGVAKAIVLFDVFHHLRRPVAALRECSRVLASGGRIILLEPFVSLTSSIVYALFHPEPVAWRTAIDISEEPPADDYYAAQGNATRIFFQKRPPQLPLAVVRTEAFAAWHYLLSGGFTRPAMYPVRILPMVKAFDRILSRAPRLFGGRCLVVMEKR